MSKPMLTANWQIVTSCSSIKRRQDAAITPSLKAKTLDELCSTWVRKISTSKTLSPVIETYGGRSFTEAIKAAHESGFQLNVISAGLGLVDAGAMIPNYNLTVSKGQGSIADWLDRKNLKSSDWWQALNLKLNRNNPIQELVRNSHGVLFALPSTYLDLIVKELQSLSDINLAKVHLITSESGQRMLPDSLQARCIPYDERLEGSNQYKGTRNDFAQRALHHYVSQIDFRSNSIESSRSEVIAFLSKLNKPQIPVRKKLDDSEIIKLIKRNWKQCDGRREGLLRHLRDSVLVACEQKRFGNLWNQVRFEYEIRAYK
jgi:hypothetical protein